MSAANRRRALIAGAVLIAVGAAGAWYLHGRLPGRFAEVVPDRLYRSGGVTPRQLELLVRRYGIRTVLSLLNPDAEESIAERRAAERLGLRWVNVALPGDGSSTPAQREQIKAVLFDARAEPLLVHCAAGVNRTGLAVGLYRIHRQGWSVEQVLAEMRAFGFEDLPRHENLRQALRVEHEAAQHARWAPSRGSGP